jgi:hypothetical protein
LDNLRRRGELGASGSTPNIGIATGKESGIIVIDEDSYKENKGELGFDLPKTLRQSTGGGGRHFFFKYPKDVVIKNSAGSLANAVDVRGDGGIVVAAPSRHKSGKQYEINCEYSEISEAPEQLVRHILENQPTSLQSTVKEYGVEAVEKFGLEAARRENNEWKRSEMAYDVEIPKGKRNETLFKQACKLQGDGLGDGAVRAAIHEQNAEFCKPMLEYEEVENLVESALKYGKGDRIWEASLETADENFDERNLFLSWGEILQTEYETPEYTIYGLPKGSVGMVVGITNFGKSSFLRNLAVSLATGSPYLDMVDEGEPKRVMLLDYETPFAFYKADIEKMVSILPEEKKKLVETNLRSVQNIKKAFEHFSNVVVSDFDPIGDEKLLAVLYGDMLRSEVSIKHYKTFAEEVEKTEQDTEIILNVLNGFSNYIRNSPKESKELKEKINGYFRILNLIEYVIDFDKKFIVKTWLEFWRRFNNEYNNINKSDDIVDDVLIYFDNKIGVIEPTQPKDGKPKVAKVAKANGTNGNGKEFKFDILAVIEKRNEEEKEIEKLIQDFEEKIEKLFAFILLLDDGKRLIAKMKSAGNAFSEDEIYNDFTTLYKKFVRRNRDNLGDFFINETRDSVHKLCDDFEKYIQQTN